MRDELHGCLGCRLLAAALPRGGTVLPHCADHWDLVAGMLHASKARAGLGLEDVVVVVGNPDLLPAELRGRGDYTMMTTQRTRMVGRYSEPFATVFAPLRDAPRPGHVWVLASIGAPGGGQVVLFSHRAPPAPSASAVRVLDLALVPEDGGPAPGAGISAPGGRA